VLHECETALASAAHSVAAGVFPVPDLRRQIPSSLFLRINFRTSSASAAASPSCLLRYQSTSRTGPRAVAPRDVSSLGNGLSVNRTCIVRPTQRQNSIATTTETRPGTHAFLHRSRREYILPILRRVHEINPEVFYFSSRGVLGLDEVEQVDARRRHEPAIPCFLCAILPEVHSGVCGSRGANTRNHDSE